MIFVASLFSHLSPADSGSWLQKPFSLLRPDGILIFSVFDEYLMLPSHGQIQEEGYRCVAINEEIVAGTIEVPFE